ncbi:FliH/SctL family protein [Naasia sp. SYSU D00057]|uniref:FliH/SctL family protein n=1 Tax=Naasia sp. SYSU D00057 TaxID=2817380 RepID=UPI001B300F92|nr:FliH/SctL family protein [Naasia sp. SYSU D00057]
MSTDFAPLAYPVLRDDAARAAEERARIAGHAAGYAAGRRAAAAAVEAERLAQQAEHDQAIAAGRARLAAAAQALTLAAARLDAATAPVLAAVDASLLAASVELAEALVDRELASAPDAPLDRVRRVLDGATEQLPVRVRLAPADAELAGTELEGIAVLADAALHRGDAVVELPDGILDARIAAALDRARAVLGEGR